MDKGLDRKWQEWTERLRDFTFPPAFCSLGILYHGAQQEVCVSAVLDGSEVCVSWLVRPRRLRTPAAAMSLSCHFHRRGLTVTFLGPKIEGRTSFQHHKTL